MHPGTGNFFYVEKINEANKMSKVVDLAELKFDVQKNMKSSYLTTKERKDDSKLIFKRYLCLSASNKL